MRTAFVELKPRFPLFGGWQTEFTFGYSLPLHSIVSRLADGRLRLKTDFSTPFESMVVDDLTVKVRGCARPGRPMCGPRSCCSMQLSEKSGLIGIARGHVPAKCRSATPSPVLSAGRYRVSHLRDICCLEAATGLATPLSRTQACMVPSLLQGALQTAPPATRRSGPNLATSTACCCLAGGAACRHIQHGALVASSHLLACDGSCLMAPSASRQASCLHHPARPLAPCCPTGRKLPDGTSNMSAEVSSCTALDCLWALQLVLPKDASCIRAGTPSA